MTYIKLLKKVSDWPEEKATMEATINSMEEEKNKTQDEVSSLKLEVEKSQETFRHLE